MKELEKYYQSLIQDITATQTSNEEGDSQEQVFTRIAVDLLADAGETENVEVAYDEKEIGKKGQHKINAYAVSDNYETVDLFISIFNFSDTITIIPKTAIDRATTRITNFFIKAVQKDYVNDIEESSQIFEFANTLANYKELKENLIRVNATILTNGEYKGDFPQSIAISGYNIYYRIIDINYLYKISEESRIPIEIDFNNFEGNKYLIPCLTDNNNNPDYKSIIAILPGICVSSLYERYGARLLEQNVRSFLQFTGKINKGIRDTIRNEPHMFLAFNNGISATADNIEFDNTGRYVSKINNLQIVNGGQTTASIYNTYKKDKVDISNIYVQVKFSIIDNPENYAEIVSRISRYSNTQNKVNDADFSANNPALIALEKLSRYVLSPITTQNNMQTCWFFERARGQYKTYRSREARTKNMQLAFDKKHPRSQTFTKVELAKYINSYQEVWEGKKLVVGPHIVVIANNLPDNPKKINSVYFEDTIAKCILFKNADKRYGKKPDSIGEMKQVVVPYTISLLNIITEDKLDLYKIWKNQCVSSNLSDFIYNLMKQVNQFILQTYYGQHYIEKAKREECWNLIKENIWSYNIKEINNDLVDENNPPKRKTDIDISEEELKYNKDIVKSIPPALWYEILNWGKDSGYLNITKQAIVSNIAYKLRENKILSDDEYLKGVEILDVVAKYNVELLQETEKYSGQWVQMKRLKIDDDENNQLILGQVKKMISFNIENKTLSTEDIDFLYDVLNNKIVRDYEVDNRIVYNLQKLIKKGFTP